MFTLDWEEDNSSTSAHQQSQSAKHYGHGLSNGLNNGYSHSSGAPGGHSANHTQSTEIDHAIVTAKLEAHARRSKKKKNGLRHVTPADKVTRGFQTPPLSIGEESDSSACATPMMRSLSKNSTTATGSPSLRPSNLTRAFSGLKLDTAPAESSTPKKLAADTSDSSTPSNRPGSSPPEIGTYEVPISRDFASVDSQPKPLSGVVEGGLRHDSPHRKMTATDFEALKCLGKGAFGTVLLVKQHSTGRLYAQKQLKKASLKIEKRLIDQAKNERSILESVNRHPFVVKLFYAFQDQQKLYLILEYAQGGELFHHLAMERTFTEETAAFYMAEMALALDHLHRNLGVVYRDLKPENCLLDAEGHLLLTDFGLSKVSVEDVSEDEGASKCTSIVGTIDYMAPEAVQGKQYDSAVDWWSLGALGYDLLTGSPPFSANNRKKTEQKIVHGKVAPPYYLSPDAKDLLVRLLRKEPRKRLGGNMPKDMVTIKSHRFFRKIDWKALSTREVPAPIQPIITDPAEAENFDKEFTSLAMSPIDDTSSGAKDILSGRRYSRSDDPFGGFSFVASRSLIDCD